MVAQQDKPTELPIFIVTFFHEVGETGVHTHFREFRAYLEQCGTPVEVITPFCWNRPLTYLAFPPRLVLKYVSAPAGVWWYRYWHEVFTYRALRRRLSEVDECVVYAQGPPEAKAALRARRGPQQSVSMAVHFRVSQADEHSEPGREIKRDGALYRAIRRLEREVILGVDSLIYVSEWARDAVLAWLPEAASVPAAVIGNAVVPLTVDNPPEKMADLVSLGTLEDRKNHRFLLEVLAEAKRNGRRLTLDVYGVGPLQNELTRQISSLGLEGQVCLRGFQRDVRQVLPAYRVYVHASYKETSSLAIIEAMAAGLPIVAGGIGPIPELYDDGVEGRFWPLDDPARAAAILLDLLDSESALEKASIAARQRFHREFDINASGARLKSFLLKAAARRTG
jgi:glycosyltransferase involved in cell wall biosynthesis